MNDQPGAFPTAARTECEFPQPGQNRVPKATAADGPQQPRASPVVDIRSEAEEQTPIAPADVAAIRDELAHLTDGFNCWAGRIEALSGDLQQLKIDKRVVTEMHDRNQSLAEQLPWLRVAAVRQSTACCRRCTDGTSPPARGTPSMSRSCLPLLLRQACPWRHAPADHNSYRHRAIRHTSYMSSS